MPAVVAGFAIIFRRGASGGDFGISAELIGTFGNVVLNFLGGEFVNHTCGLFVKFDIAQCVPLAVNDRVGFPWYTERKIVINSITAEYTQRDEQQQQTLFHGWRSGSPPNKERPCHTAPTKPRQRPQKDGRQDRKVLSGMSFCVLYFNWRYSWEHYIGILTQNADNISGFQFKATSSRPPSSSHVSKMHSHN